MLYFEENGNKSVLLLPNRTTEFFVFKILEHISSTKLYLSNKNICRHILVEALCHTTTRELINEIWKKIGENVYFKYPNVPIQFEPFFYITNTHYLNFCHFITFFDAVKYIQNKMNKIYWSYIDRNIHNGIKYRKRKRTHYEERIKTICESLKNVTFIESVSFLLFIRYKEALEPYFLLHSLLNNITPVLKVKYYIGNTSRACSFGENCRGGWVFVGCKSVSTTHTFNINYCLCNRHLRELKSNYKLKFIS